MCFTKCLNDKHLTEHECTQWIYDLYHSSFMSIKHIPHTDKIMYLLSTYILFFSRIHSTLQSFSDFIGAVKCSHYLWFGQLKGQWKQTPGLPVVTFRRCTHIKARWRSKMLIRGKLNIQLSLKTNCPNMHNLKRNPLTNEWSIQLSFGLNVG